MGLAAGLQAASVAAKELNLDTHFFVEDLELACSGLCPRSTIATLDPFKVAKDSQWTKIHRFASE